MIDQHLALGACAPQIAPPNPPPPTKPLPLFLLPLLFRLDRCSGCMFVEHSGFFLQAWRLQPVLSAYLLTGSCGASSFKCTVSHHVYTLRAVS